MKMRNKGKVYPSSSSAYSPLPVASPPLSVLNLLPATILGLAVVLSLEDRQVLAYMITRSIKSTNPPSSSTADNKKKTSNTHIPPLFDCDCFDCYTSYWFKWDSSPNRELIHQAIEAFEESLSNGEKSKKKGKKRDKMGHRHVAGKAYSSPPAHQGVQVLPECNVSVPVEEKAIEAFEDSLSNDEKSKKKGEKREKIGHRHLAGKAYISPPELQGIQVFPEYDVPPAEEQAQESVEDEDRVLSDAEGMTSAEAEGEAPVRGAASQHKGLARKVLPDVIGLFNWRLWSLWSPNV